MFRRLWNWLKAKLARSGRLSVAEAFVVAEMRRVLGIPGVSIQVFGRHYDADGYCRLLWGFSGPNRRRPLWTPEPPPGFVRAELSCHPFGESGDDIILIEDVELPPPRPPKPVRALSHIGDYEWARKVFLGICNDRVAALTRPTKG